MAKMIPEILNPETKNNPRKQGEIKFYQCLQNKLGNDWTVFYNVNWLGKAYASGNTRDGETDFIVANPKFGVLVVEVKGGQIIEYEGLASQWYGQTREKDKIITA